MGDCNGIAKLPLCDDHKPIQTFEYFWCEVAACSAPPPRTAHSRLTFAQAFNSLGTTIFSLASEGLGKRAAEGSGLICVAIVGGAIIPPLTGAVADATTLQWARIVPAHCYAVILGYGVYARRPVVI